MERRKIKRLWSPRNVNVIPLIFGALGSVTKTSWFVTTSYSSTKLKILRKIALKISKNVARESKDSPKCDRYVIEENKLSETLDH